MEENICKHKSDKRYFPEYTRNLQNSTTKTKQQNIGQKIGKKQPQRRRMDASTHIERSSVSLVNREMQIKTKCWY